MSNMSTLRQNIFGTMEGLKNGTVKVTEAKAMSECAQVLINSLKVEIDAYKLAGTKQLPDFVSGGAVLISRGVVEETEETLKPEELSPDQLDLLALAKRPVSETPNVTIHKGRYGA